MEVVMLFNVQGAKVLLCGLYGLTSNLPTRIYVEQRAMLREFPYLVVFDPSLKSDDLFWLNLCDETVWVNSCATTLRFQ